MDDHESQLRRRRRSMANPNLSLHLDAGYQVSESGPSRGTPSPSGYKSASSFKDHSPSSALVEFRKKQQSFDIQIEECEEEEILIESDEEADQENLTAVETVRPVTPTPVQDFGANVVYTEGPKKMEFLQVKVLEQDCVTDVSDDETDEE